MEALKKKELERREFVKETGEPSGPKAGEATQEPQGAGPSESTPPGEQVVMTSDPLPNEVHDGDMLVHSINLAADKRPASHHGRKKAVGARD